MSQPLGHSSKKITFSWEKKPGVSKEIRTSHGENLIQRDHDQYFPPNYKLPPPPCSSAEAASAKNILVHDFQIPLPPCPFQPPYYRTSSKKGLWVQDDDDPFLAAYKECTKNQKSCAKRNNSSESRLRKCLSFFSCKRSSTVCDDNNLVRVSSRFPQDIDRDN